MKRPKDRKRKESLPKRGSTRGDAPKATQDEGKSSPPGTRKPIVSFCIISNSGLAEAKHRSMYLARLLKSILVCGVPKDRMEVIVAGVAQSLPDWVHYKALPEAARDGKIGVLRNASIAESSGEWIVHCDDDVLLPQGYWKAVAARLDGSHDILCTRLLNPNGTRYWDWAAFVPGRGQTLLPYDVQHDHVYATGGHGIYRRKVFDQIRWSESIAHGGNEEWEFAAQARKVNLHYGIIPEVAVYLQYHHCDALAAVSGQIAQPAEPFCEEFRRLVASLDGHPEINLPSNGKSELWSRLVYKWQPPAVASSSPEVSILVGCYKYLQRFRVFAQGLCHQTADPHSYEIVVANPNSPDGLHGFLQTLEQACSRVDPKTGRRAGPVIKEVPVEEKYYRNRGYMIQKAFEQSTGSIVVGMDCDVVVPSDFIATIRSSVLSNENKVVGCYRKFLTSETTNQILSGLIDPIKLRDTGIEEDQEEESGYRGVLGYCQAALRSHWERVNGYPVQFDNIAKSDVEFIEQLAKFGIEPLFLRNVELLHLFHPREWTGTTTYL